MDIAIVLMLVLFNGMLAMSEMAVVSSRRARLQKLSDDGAAGASAALRLHEFPSNFLSTVQIGITAVGILSGVVGEDILAKPLETWLAQFSAIAPYARSVSLVIVVLGITYTSVVFGELVPKRLALLAPETIASLVAKPMMFLSRAFRPLVWLLSSSTDLVLKLLHVRRSAASVVSDEEIKVMMEQGSEHGVFHENEQEIVSNVLRLDDQRVSAIMTPRMALYGIDLSAPENVIRERVAESPFNRLVVYRNGLENIVGIVEKGALLKELLQGRSLDIESALKPAVFVPESVTTAQLLDNLQGTHMRIALIIDEYGTLRGLVSMTDVLTAIIGDLAVTGEPAVDEARQREDGSWLLDGAMSLERFGNLPGIDASEEEVDDNVHTLGGYAMTRLGRIPVVGDRFEAMGLRFEVVDMDRNRVDKVLVTPLPRQDPPGEQ